MIGRPTALAIALAIVAGGLLFVPGRNSNGGVAQGPARAVPLRVGIVFDVGGRGDKSFNDAAYAGSERAVRELGADVAYLEPSGAEDREAGLRLFAARGYDLVIAVGFIFSPDVDVVARAHPNVHFACIDYFPGRDGVPANVAALAFREEEGSFLVGGAAGLLSKSKHVGFVGGMTGPLIKKFEVGYSFGVHRTCPECVVHVAYAGSSPDAYRDPAKGKALTESQVAATADVVYHASGATGHGVFEAAKLAGISAIGVDVDQHDEMPGAVVTSMVKRADVAIFETVKAVAEGRFKSGFQVFGLKEEGVDWVHEGPHADRLPDALKRRVEALREDVKSGLIHVPAE